LTGRCRRTAAAVVVWVSCTASPLHAQPAATIGIGASVVQYEGFLTSGAATLTAALSHDAPSLSVGGQGGWTVFESGNQIFQATAAAAWLTEPGRRWRVELSGSGGVSRYADHPAAGHLLARGRLHVFGGNNGGWLGATAGASSDNPYPPVEFGIGAWHARDRFALVGALTGTWLDGDQYLDVLGAARWTGGRFELEARAGARPWANSPGDVGDARSGVWGEISALIPLAARIDLAMSAGSYPSDPVRRVLSATYATVGLRLALARPESRMVPALVDARVAAARARTASRSGGVLLEIEPAGDLRTLRVRVDGVKSVELMGDFTDWQTVLLTQVHAGTWETTLPLTPGVHRLNVRVDGGPWLVPAGARSEPNDFGGEVGVIFVR
jgi:hypothetical protein